MDGMAVFETKPDGSGPFELPASVLAGQLVNESRCFDNDALRQVFYNMPAHCGSRLAHAPMAAGTEDRAANKTTPTSRGSRTSTSTSAWTAARPCGLQPVGQRGTPPGRRRGGGLPGRHTSPYSPLVVHLYFRQGLRDGMHRPLQPAARRHADDSPRRVPRHVGCAAPPKFGQMPREAAVSQRQMPPRAVPRVGQSRPMSALVVLLGQMGFGLHGRYDDEVWLHAMAVRNKPVPSTSVYRAALPAAYWTWGGSNNNLNSKGTPGRDICVRAQARHGCREPPPHPSSAGHTHHTTQRPPTASPCQPGLSPVAKLELSAGAVCSRLPSASLCGGGPML